MYVAQIHANSGHAGQRMLAVRHPDPILLRALFESFDFHFELRLAYSRAKC